MSGGDTTEREPMELKPISSMLTAFTPRSTDKVIQDWCLSPMPTDEFDINNSALTWMGTMLAPVHYMEPWPKCYYVVSIVEQYSISSIAKWYCTDDEFDSGEEIGKSAWTLWFLLFSNYVNVTNICNNALSVSWKLPKSKYIRNRRWQQQSQLKGKGTSI